MTVLVWITWLATAAVLVTYFRMQRGHGSLWFDWANAIGSIPLAAMDIIVGAIPAAVVSICFGVIAWYGHAVAWRERRALDRWRKEIIPNVEVVAWGESVAVPEAGLLVRTVDKAWQQSKHLHAEYIEELRARR